MNCTETLLWLVNAIWMALFFYQSIPVLLPDSCREYNADVICLFFAWGLRMGGKFFPNPLNIAIAGNFHVVIFALPSPSAVWQHCTILRLAGSARRSMLGNCFLVHLCNRLAGSSEVRSVACISSKIYDIAFGALFTFLWKYRDFSCIQHK